jgi:hypothetical protein
LRTGHVRDPSRPRAADRLRGERDEPLAAQSPRVGRRQVHVLHERPDARDGPDRRWPCSWSGPGTEPRLLAIAHAEPIEVPGTRPRVPVRRCLCRVLVTVIAAAGREADHERGQDHHPKLRARAYHAARRTRELEGGVSRLGADTRASRARPAVARRDLRSARSGWRRRRARPLPGASCSACQVRT